MNKLLFFVAGEYSPFFHYTIGGYSIFLTLLSEIKLSPGLKVYAGLYLIVLLLKYPTWCPAEAVNVSPSAFTLTKGDYEIVSRCSQATTSEYYAIDN